jgi:translation initiation factor 2 alpha subunit (eIF-2alpha)
MELEEGSIVLCTVTKIVGTTVFVRLDSYGVEGTIMTSEIAPGRIRNLRDYVVPNKKIVCKILRMDNHGHIDLSLRRVSAKERRELLEFYQVEKGLESTLKAITDNSQEVIQKIREKSTLVEFFESAKENPKLLDNYFDKEKAERLLKIINEKKEKEISVKKKLTLSSKSEDGILKIKRILPKETTYIAAGKYLITIKDKNYKDANQKLNFLISEIEKKAKAEKCFFEAEK